MQNIHISLLLVPSMLFTRSLNLSDIYDMFKLNTHLCISLNSKMDALEKHFSIMFLSLGRFYMINILKVIRNWKWRLRDSNKMFLCLICYRLFSVCHSFGQSVTDVNLLLCLIKYRICVLIFGIQKLFLCQFINRIV